MYGLICVLWYFAFTGGDGSNTLYASTDISMLAMFSCKKASFCVVFEKKVEEKPRDTLQTDELQSKQTYFHSAHM